ncbi:MAG: DegT/DnrJ/EryC1/StrS family aminotransferase, partial [Planctomycetes bacterium]|nr:DegT/DnrJ/EryC1/StrS family aminotransferase [Planctomycetota bacterium]
MDLGHLILPTAPLTCRVGWFVYVVRLTDEFDREDRDTLLDDLMSQGIQVSNYFPPVHLQPFMAQQFNYRPGDFPVTEGVSQRTIALPFHNNLSPADIESVCQALRKSIRTLLQRRPKTSAAL